MAMICNRGGFACQLASCTRGDILPHLQIIIISKGKNPLGCGNCPMILWGPQTQIWNSPYNHLTEFLSQLKIYQIMKVSAFQFYSFFYFLSFFFESGSHSAALAGCPQTQRSASLCLCLLSAGIKGLRHHGPCSSFITTESTILWGGV